MTKRVIIVELEFEDETDSVPYQTQSDVGNYLNYSLGLIADDNFSYEIINEDIPSEFTVDERELYIEGIPCDVCGETTTSGKTSCLRTQFSTTECPYHMLNVVGEIK
jgi:hypothetical protein